MLIVPFILYRKIVPRFHLNVNKFQQIHPKNEKQSSERIRREEVLTPMTPESEKKGYDDMKQLMSKTWWKSAGRRAIKIGLQVAVSMTGTNALLQEIRWRTIVSAAVLAGILSLLSSIVELSEPEPENDQEAGEKS